MKIRKIISAVISVTLAGALFAGCSSPSQSSGTDATTAAAALTEKASGTSDITASVVNIAIQPSASFSPLYIAREKGWIEEALSEYGVTVNWNDFESGPPMNESLAAGASDIGVVGDVPVVSAIAAGQNNEIIAIASHAPQSYGVVVAADSDIKSAADLKGKTLATTIGSTSHEHFDMLGIPRDTLYGWIKKWRDGYLDIGPEARSPENVQHLNEEVEQLRQRVKEQERTIRRLQEEREILADATAFFASSRRKLGSGKD